MANQKSEKMTAGRPSVRKAARDRTFMADPTDTVRVNFDLAREKHVRLKVHAARTGRSVADILRGLVDGLED